MRHSAFCSRSSPCDVDPLEPLGAALLHEENLHGIAGLDLELLGRGRGQDRPVLEDDYLPLLVHQANLPLLLDRIRRAGTPGPYGPRRQRKTACDAQPPASSIHSPPPPPPLGPLSSR